MRRRVVQGGVGLGRKPLGDVDPGGLLVERRGVVGCRRVGGPL